ncbi:MAG TPA: DedA family protein [Candidatus Eisenbacteria bacterium]|nr:DedA family protein [Candidatus Eisenbacteria bacterium]
MNWFDLVDAVGNPVAGFGSLIETAGVPFPGEALLLGASGWAAARHQSVLLVILIGFAGATAGADIGYLVGYKGGRPFVERFGSFFRIRPEHIARSELFFARHGDRAILAGRFVLGMRTWGSMLAGMSRMPFWRFQLLSAIGGLAWAVVIGVAGYLVGSNLALLQAIIRGIGLGGLIVLAMIAVILLVAQHLAASRPR